MGSAGTQIVATACVVAGESADPAAALRAQLPDIDIAFLILLVTPDLELESFLPQFEQSFPGICTIGARTAGELSDKGYSDGNILLLAFPKSHFTAEARLFQLGAGDNDSSFVREILAMRQDVQTGQAGFDHEFAFLLVDGLSRREDTLVSHISAALGTTQLFGGSSGDGLRFDTAPIIFNGAAHTNAAILLIARSRCRVQIFREDHFETTAERLIVTGAIPEERLVTEINAEPAAPEYARIVGIDPAQLTPFIFASHPILVTVGDQHHVRAIQKVEEKKYLRFFSSIDEGMVMTVAKSGNIVEHLEQVLTRLSQPLQPDLIFACDCILRRLEAEQTQGIGKMSQLIRAHRVFGFSTYGEQHNMLHVNQTLTGLAIYPPDDDRA